MAVLRIRLYEPAEEELERLWNGGRPPRWVARTLESRGAGAGQPGASALVEALGEELERRLSSLVLLLRRAEARGWTVTFRGGCVEVTTGLAPDATRRALEADGTWLLLHRLVDAGRAVVI